MARVLLVEDEERYRDVVARYLTLGGHDVLDTSSGEEAIVLGLAHAPDVLVADWMLRHSVHGLHVAETLRMADPALHTVLVTGFPDSDLTMDRDKVGIVELLEKPFDMDDLGAAVERAAAETAGAESEAVAVFRLDPSGFVIRANRSARAISGADVSGKNGLDAVLAPESFVRFSDSTDRWIRVSDAEGASYWLRSRLLPDGGHLAVLCAGTQEWRRDDLRVRMLLGLPSAPRPAGAFTEPILLVDDSETIGDSFVAQLASRGCAAHAASTHGRALEIFRSDPDIRVVILDWAMPGEDLRATVAQLREVRPEVRLIGTSGSDRRTDFREFGIGEFLQKPWTVVGDLASLLGSGVGQPSVAQP